MTYSTWLRRASLVFGCIVMSWSFEAGAQLTPEADIKRYYELSFSALELLGDQLSIEAQPLLDATEMDVAIEDYITRLDASDYARFVSRYVRDLQSEEFEALVDNEFSPAFDFYIDQIDEMEFAEIYRQFLGELTSTYLTSAPDIDFTEYVLSQILQLSSSQYSTLYQDYIRTLWSYFIDSASSEELAEMLGEDYEEFLTTTDFSIDNPAFFELITNDINSLTETEFVAIYTAYVTEMIGGLIDDPSILEPQVPEAPAENGADPTEAPPAAADGESVVEAPEVVAEPVITGLAAIAFTDLTPGESLNLLRLHIATVARSYFIGPFRASLEERTESYTAAATQEQLAALRELEGIMALIQSSLDSYNESNRQLLASIESLLDEAFLFEVRSKLQFVENIPYPNTRLLRIAILQVLSEYDPSSAVAGDKLTQQQYNILLAAIEALVMQYDQRGVVPSAETAGQGTEAETPTTAAPGTGAVSWDFLGCGCDIEEQNVIYGFYPTWNFPIAGSPPQEVDLRFYDRIAYFGLTLDSSGDFLPDTNWRRGSPMNEFIQGAHHRWTEVDLAIYAPFWHQWDDVQIGLISGRILDRFSIPLDYGPMTTFADNFLTPVYPTYSETIGRDYMGDGLTLFFDSLEDPDTGEVRDLSFIVQLVTTLAAELRRNYPEDYIPINLMLDFHQENTEDVLSQLRPVIIGTAEDSDQYIARLLMFLEQDTWASSQGLIESVRTVFVNDDSATVMSKLNPILIPAMDSNGQFDSLTRDLRDLRWNFGTAGGAAIWPIPIENSEKGRLIEQAFVSAMVTEVAGFWQDLERDLQSFYFRDRLVLIFNLTLFYSISLLILLWSIREPIKPFILILARVVGVFTFAIFVLSALFIDPYLNWWRIAYFVVPLLFVLLVVPLQNTSPQQMSVNVKGNKFINRSMKRGRSRVVRGLRRSLRKAIWSRNAG
ncbi:MAG: hypothetical protein MI746_15405 [Pseudomonadales bacterium]|nr:hypothetical protein [Pseudomonadales bacterium]